jgi:hypothetical protein
MYKIIGADGKEYGPVNLDRLREWLGQGRFTPRTKVQCAGGTEWIEADQVPELAPLFVSQEVRRVGQGAPPIIKPPTSSSVQQKGLAITSLVLGLCSFALCLSVVTGIPAIICGHVARHRAARFPAQYAGGGIALAGTILGYLSLVCTFVIAAFVLPSIPRVKPVPQLTDCQNNLKQIGLSFKVWELEHNDQFPFNVSTNSGGTLELCAPGPDGFDKNAIAHFLIISNELSTPSFLVCPNDPAKHPAASFDKLQAANVSYRLRTGTNINSENPQEVLAVCPIHGNQLFCDGNVRKAAKVKP